MTSDNSLFSCIKPVEEPARYTPPSPPPAGRQEEAFAQVTAALQDRVKKLEDCTTASASAAEAARAEAKAAQDRSAELEKRLAAINDSLRAFMDKSVNLRPDQAELDTLKGEITSCTGRMVSIEKDMHLLESDGIRSVSLSLRLLEGRFKSVEAGLNDELHERFSAVSLSVGESARKAALALETAAAGARRLEKLEELLVRLPYVENRFATLETKLERIYELDALAQALKMSVEGTEGKLALVMKEAAAISGGQKRLGADFESLSAQVRQMAALFNQFRTELSFLIPKKRGDLVRD